MWFLTSKSDQRVISIAPVKGKVTIGRSVDPEVCDFSVPEDVSISRKHATISLQGEDLILTDLGSKYGTFVNQPASEKKGIDRDVQKTLHEDDTVRFGALTSVWTVSKVDFVTCASTLKGENLQKLQSYLNKLGGTFKNEWDNSCSYLTMPALTLTIKVVLALVQGANIVTLAFWEKCCEAIENYAKLPEPKDFLPQVVESTINKDVVSFSPNLKRRRIFADKKFVFLSKRQLEMYRNVLMMGSATPLLLSESKMTKSMLAAPDVIVIQYIINNTTQESQALQTQIKGIVDYLKSKGKRVVADAEIGLAILYCSLEKYCNPFFDYSSEVLKETNDAQNSKRPINVLAPESQEPSVNKKMKTETTVDESLSNNDSERNNEESNGSAKRKLSTDSSEVVQNMQKKVATESNVTNNGNDDDNDLFEFIKPNPAPRNDNDGNKNSLSFLKPLKRKQEDSSEMDDDNLFNFVTTDKEQASGDASTKNLFDQTKIKEDPITPQIKRQKIEEEFESKLNSTNFSALFEKSIKALLESNANWRSSEDIPVLKIKKEDVSEQIEEKLSELDLGTTVVTVNPKLIVENKPVNVEEQSSQVKNFKRFKKVWPLKMQITIIPKSEMSFVKPEPINDIPCAGINESENKTHAGDDIISTTVNTNPSSDEILSETVSTNPAGDQIMNTEPVAETVKPTSTIVDFFKTFE